MKKIILLVSFFAFIMVSAQNTNLIENGGFEDAYTDNMGRDKFRGWLFDNGLHQRKVAGHQGNGVKMYNTGSFSTYKSRDYKTISVQGKAEYTLSFWYKGEKSKEIEPHIDWYKKNGQKLSVENISRRSSSSSYWEEQKYVFKAPAGAVNAKLWFSVYGWSGSVTIDDISLIKTAEPVSNLEPPTGFRITSYQREMQISWSDEFDENGDKIENTQWEIVVNGETKTINKPYYFLTNLEPNTSYNIKVRTIIGNEMSDFTEKNQRTRSFLYGKDNEFRVPHLRTLGTYGTCSKTIDLFYNDLYNANAEIKYFIDDKLVQPNGYKLEFQKTGNQILKIQIKEAKGYEWDIIYKLDVK